MTYGVFAQSPAHFIEAAPGSPPNEFGNKSDLEQYQSFRKDAEGAKLSFTVTKVRIEAIDLNGVVLQPFECPPGCLAAIEGEAILSVQAYTSSGRHFYNTSGGAKVFGHVGNFDFKVWRDTFANAPFWDEGDFSWEPHNGRPLLSNPILELRGRRTFSIDISSVPVGEAFTLRSNTFARAYDRRLANGDDRLGSTVFAYLRDPLEVGGSASCRRTGLTRVADPLLDTPAPDAGCAGRVRRRAPTPTPERCSSAPLRSAIGEWDGAGPQVFVTRTGGSTGDGERHVHHQRRHRGRRHRLHPVDQHHQVRRRRHHDPGRPGRDREGRDRRGRQDGQPDPVRAELHDLGRSVQHGADDRRRRRLPTPTFTIGGTVTGLEGTGPGAEDSWRGDHTRQRAVRVHQDRAGRRSRTSSPSTHPADRADADLHGHQRCRHGGRRRRHRHRRRLRHPAARRRPRPDLRRRRQGHRRRRPGRRPGASSSSPTARSSPPATTRSPATTPTAPSTRRSAATASSTTGLDDDCCFADGANDVALQPDGKIVVVGIVDDGGADDENFGVQRYDADGDLDTELR